MGKFKRKRISIIARLRNYFITGIVVLVPIGITLYLTKFFITLSSKLIPSEYSLSFIGKKILQLFNDLLKKIPLLRTIYSAMGQMAETLAPKRKSKKSVVLIEYPRKGSWAVGFATKENTSGIADKAKQDLVNVFIPTTPNPTSGFLLMFPKKDVIYLDITFEQASKFIVSAGTSDPK